jgi:SAM-dependent methyltransferase
MGMGTKTCDSFLNCPEEKKHYLTIKGYPIKECKKCGHRFIHLDDAENRLNGAFSDSYFFGGKECYPNYLNGKDSLVSLGTKYAKIISKYAKPGKMLDVGCAAGFIMKGFEKEGWECHGLEPNDTMASYGRNELNLDIYTGGFEDYPKDEKYDLVNMVQVLCTFHDVDKGLRTLSGLLNKGGLSMVEMWDMKSFAARIMGRYWHEYSPPSVVNWYSDKTITHLFNYYGFELIAQGRPYKKIKINLGLTRLDETLPRFPFKKSILKFLTRTIGKYNMVYPPVDLKWYLFRKL